MWDLKLILSSKFTSRFQNLTPSACETLEHYLVVFVPIVSFDDTELLFLRTNDAYMA